MKTLSYSPDPRNRILNSQNLVHSAFIQAPIYQPNPVNFSPITPRKVVLSTHVSYHGNNVNNGGNIGFPKKRSNSQSNIELSGYNPNNSYHQNNAAYLQSLEQKVSLVLQENEKLLRVLNEKELEIQSYRQIEPKIQLLLEENLHLNEMIKGKPGSTEKEKDHSDDRLNTSKTEELNNKLNYLIEENEKLESLVENLQENFKKEMLEYQQETESKIIDLMQENEKLIEINKKDVEIREKFQVILTENEKMNLIINQKNSMISEISKVNNEIEMCLAEYETRIRVLCQENDRLSEVLIQKLNGELTIEPKVHTILGKNSELLLLLDEKNGQINQFQQEIQFLRESKKMSENNVNDLEFHKNDYDQLKLQFVEVTEDLENLRKECNELKKALQNRVSEEDFKKLEEKNRSLEEKILETNKEFVEELKYNDKEKIEMTLSFKEKCNHLLQENEKLLNLVNTRNEEIANLSKKVEDLNEDLEENNRENSELKKKVLNFSQNFDDFKKFIALDLKRAEFLNSYEFKNLEIEVKNLSEKCYVLQDEKELAWNENEYLKENLIANNRLISKNQIDLENANNQINEILIEKDFLQHKISDCEENQVKMDNEISILNTQLVQWKSLNENNKNEISKLYNILKSRKSENSTLLKRNEEMQKEISRLTKDATEMASETFVFKEKVTLLEKELEKVSIEKKELQNLAGSLEENFANFRKEVDGKVEDLESLRKNYHLFVNNSKDSSKKL